MRPIDMPIRCVFDSWGSLVFYTLVIYLRWLVIVPSWLIYIVSCFHLQVLVHSRDWQGCNGGSKFFIINDILLGYFMKYVGIGLFGHLPPSCTKVAFAWWLLNSHDDCSVLAWLVAWLTLRVQLPAGIRVISSLGLQAQQNWSFDVFLACNYLCRLLLSFW